MLSQPLFGFSHHHVKSAEKRNQLGAHGVHRGHSVHVATTWVQARERSRSTKTLDCPHWCLGSNGKATWRSLFPFFARIDNMQSNRNRCVRAQERHIQRGTEQTLCAGPAHMHALPNHHELLLSESASRPLSGFW
jgi:hypothetical protein